MSLRQKSFFIEKRQVSVYYLNTDKRPDGSEGENSDFDALVIADSEKKHDSSVIGGFVLDVFIFSPETFTGEYDPGEYVQLRDGLIVLDRNGQAAALKRKVIDFIRSRPGKTPEEIEQEVGWCEKMVQRGIRDDAEGYFRRHWLPDLISLRRTEAVLQRCKALKAFR